MRPPAGTTPPSPGPSPTGSCPSRPGGRTPPPSRGSRTPPSRWTCWGGVSPLTPDFVNPEAPWPDITRLGELSADAGYALRERLTVYPEYVMDDSWIDAGLRDHVRALADDAGLALPGGPTPMAVAA